MASIKESTDANGQSKYYVHWKDEKSGHGRRRIFKSIDDAAHLFWQKQNSELDCRTASWAGIDHSWTFRKLILFYLGYQAGKLEKNILHISHRDIVDSVRTGCHRWIRSAFFLLVEKRLITFNPVDRPARRKRRPITIPPSSSVRELLNNAPVRERIACWLGICGLRIGEALAVTYNDVSADWIDIRGHVVDGVIHEGLKRGVERRVRMPRELFALLDKSKLGTSEPLICNQFTGACLATSYGTQGVLVRTLNDYGIKRFHHLRHFAVSRLANKGVDILKVSRLIGHSNIKTTMDVYGHLFGEVVEMDLD